MPLPILPGRQAADRLYLFGKVKSPPYYFNFLILATNTLNLHTRTKWQQVSLPCNLKNQKMKKVLITGANKSIGFETARQLLQKGFYVYLGSRDLNNGLHAVEQLKAEGLTNVEAIEIDVANSESVKAARTAIGNRTDVMDVLINNAGITGGFPQAALEATPEQFTAAFDTNVIGVVRVTQAFIDLVKKSPEPRIVMVSSS